MIKLDCGHAPSPCSSVTTGYGRDQDGRTYCYECCADRDRADMQETGRATLYLVDTPGTNGEVTNWPGSLRFKVLYRSKGRHNLARVRHDVWFWADGAKWHGVQYGENTQIAHCRRVKV
jgi:hypothetical protein